MFISIAIASQTYLIALDSRRFVLLEEALYWSTRRRRLLRLSTAAESIFLLSSSRGRSWLLSRFPSSLKQLLSSCSSLLRSSRCPSCLYSKSCRTRALLIMRAMEGSCLASGLLFLTALLHLCSLHASAITKVGFYAKTCPRAEAVVHAVVQKRFLVDKTITPALLRMLFHDSFVRGADASILIDSTPGNQAEKEAGPNLTIRGFDLIDEAKDAVEVVCPGVVSCADIIVMAVRDGVELAGGPKYAVDTGRLDGKVSLLADALTLPSPDFPVEQAKESFLEKGLTGEDMVALLGAHTVGVALCGFFNDRLYNFHGTGGADPSLNGQLLQKLVQTCPNPFSTESNLDPAVNLDQVTPALFDTSYFHEILAGRGILKIDQEITEDPTSVPLINSFSNPATFFPAFVRSIINMGNIGVITGSNPLGEIRRKCNVTNRH